MGWIEPWVYEDSSYTPPRTVTEQRTHLRAVSRDGRLGERVDLPENAYAGLVAVRSGDRLLLAWSSFCAYDSTPCLDVWLGSCE